MRRTQGVVIAALGAAVILAVLLTIRLATRDPDEIRVGYMRITAHLPVIAAEEMGIFADHRLNVRLMLYSDTPSLMRAIENKTVDVGFQVTPDMAWLSAAEGNEYFVYFIAASTQQSPIDGLYALDSLSADDLRGQPIGCFPGPTARSMLERILFEAFKLSPQDYELRQIPPNLHVPLLKSGEIKAVFTYEPKGAILSAMGARTLIAAPVEKHVVDPWYGGIGIFTRDLVAGRPKVACAFQAAIAQAIDELEAAPLRQAEYLQELDSGLTGDVARRVPSTKFIFTSGSDLRSDAIEARHQEIREYMDRQLTMYQELGVLPPTGTYNLQLFKGCK